MMMWLDTPKRSTNMKEADDDLDSLDSETSGEELPIWVRGEQRWVSGLKQETTCQDIISVLLQDEENRGRHVGISEQYHITERWRGVEQPLESTSSILDIWNAWGSAQQEVKISLRRIKNERPPSRRQKYRSDSDRASWKTIHPKRLNFLQDEKHQSSSTDELLRLVLAQGEVIRRQLKKLRNSEHQIGCLEDKAHKAREKKHGSNYLLETYLKGLSEAVDPCYEELPSTTDKNSDSGVVTEGDSEQSNHNKAKSSNESHLERFSPSSEEFHKDIHKDDDSSSTISEGNIREQLNLCKMIVKVNKRLLKEEERIVKLQNDLEAMKNVQKEKKTNLEVELGKSLKTLRTEMTKSSCEMQHNQVVLEETKEKLEKRKTHLTVLHKEIINEEKENEALQALLYSKNFKPKHSYAKQHTKEVLDTLV